MRRIFNIVILFAASFAANGSVLHMQDYHIQGGENPTAFDIDHGRAVFGVPDYRATQSSDQGLVLLCEGDIADFDCKTSFYPTPPNPQLFDHLDFDDSLVTKDFGMAVALRGDTLAIATQAWTESGEYVGNEIRIYGNDDGWKYIQSIVPAGDGDIEITADALYVGDADRVIEYKKEKTAWIKGKVITPESSLRGIDFGVSIDREGDLLLIGAPGDETSTITTGSVYLYKKVGQSWNLLERITPPDGDILDGLQFGRTVSIYGDRIYVGAPGGGRHSGRVYVYVLEGSKVADALPRTIYPPAVVQPLNFGLLIVPGKEQVLVGGPGISGSLENGGVGIFHRQENDEWNLQFEVSESVGEPQSYRDIIEPLKFDNDAEVLIGAIVNGLPSPKVLGNPNDDGVAGKDSGTGSLWAGFLLLLPGANVLRRKARQ